MTPPRSITTPPPPKSLLRPPERLRSNQLTEVKDIGGRPLKYTYTSAGYLETATDAAERTTKYAYSASGQMTSVTDGRGKTYLETEYDTNGRVSKQKVADGGTYSFAYTLGSSKQVEATTVTDPRKLERKLTFNSAGAPTSEINALGTSIQQTTSYEREAGSDQILGMTDPLGRTTAYKYDGSGNITQMTLLAGTGSARTTSYTYEPGTNERTSETDALKHTTTYHYGPRGELLSVTDPLGHAANIEYNGEGQPTVITNALGKKTTFTYELGDLTAVTDPLGRITKRFIDSVGRLGSATKPGGERTLYEYNADNQLTKTTDPLGAAITYEYDGDGDLIATTDANKHKGTATYDPLDRLESETDALEHTLKGVHNQDGYLTELVDRRGKVAQFSYDALNRLTEAKFGVSGETAESTTTYSYDSANRLTKAVDSLSGTYTPEYDAFDRLKSLATPNGTITYGYDEADRRTSMTVPGQEALKYTYDEANRLKELKRGSQIVSFAYDAANRLTKTTLPDTVEQQYGYDAANEVTSIAYKLAKATLGELNYSYDSSGRSEALWGSYARTGLPETTSSTAYNADNEQTERNGKTQSYDANGNLTSDGASEFKWNARGQLAEISGGTTAAFGYDPFGRRITKTLAGTTTKVLYDGANAVQETQGSATTNLLDGPGVDETFARTTSAGTESFLSSALGSTIGLASASGKIETSYTYDPFGATTKEGTANANPLQYAGRENDGNGLYFNRARYYSPATARFISPDPRGLTAYGPDLHPDLYTYTNNSPTNGTDPWGTYTIEREGTKDREAVEHQEQEEQQEQEEREGKRPCKKGSTGIVGPGPKINPGAEGPVAGPLHGIGGPGGDPTSQGGGGPETEPLEGPGNCIPH